MLVYQRVNRGIRPQIIDKPYGRILVTSSLYVPLNPVGLVGNQHTDRFGAISVAEKWKTGLDHLRDRILFSLGLVVRPQHI